jgi:hypothetical protein
MAKRKRTNNDRHIFDAGVRHNRNEAINYTKYLKRHLVDRNDFDKNPEVMLYHVTIT